jgi:protein-disulfide isomerase
MPTTSTKSVKTRKPKARHVIEEAEEIEFIEPTSLEEDTITFKRSHFYAALSVLTFIAGITVGYVIWGTNLLPGSAAQAGGPVVEAPVEQQYVRYDVPTKGFHSIGPADAPITIVEFSDYQCPFCRRWFQQVYRGLFNAYPGQIRLVFRNLPLTSIHPDAFAAAEAAMCAGEQNAYWEYHDKLFSNELLGDEVYIRYASDLNLDIDSFETCIKERKFKDEIQSDIDFAISLGVRSTPTFFVNGLAIVGAQPIGVFSEIIDKELAGEIPK